MSLKTVDLLILKEQYRESYHIDIKLEYNQLSEGNNVTYSKTFARQIEAMYQRLEQLYTDIGVSPSPPDFLPVALKELGVAAEELQVATEELHQQNDEMVVSLEDAASECRYYRNLFDQSPEARLVTDLEGKIDQANLAATRLINLEQMLLQGKVLINFVLPQNRSMFRTKLNRLKQLQHNCTWALCLQPRHQQPLDLLATTSVFWDENSKVAKVQWVLRESTVAWEATPLHQSFAALSSSDLAIEQPDGLPLTNGNGHSGAAAAVDDTACNSERRSIQTYIKGEVIPLTPQTLWLVHQGLVKLTTLTANSEEILLGLVGPETPFGSGSIMLPVHQATALSDVQLVRLSLAEIKTNPALALTLIPKFYLRMQQMELLLHVAGQRHVKDRLYHLLRLLKQEIGQPVPEGVQLGIRLTHEDIAVACCSTRVTITRLLGEMQRQNLIAIDAKLHIVLKKDF